MDTWAPEVLHSHQGTSVWTMDASTFATSAVSGPTGNQTALRTSSTATDTAGHAASSGQWTDAYGEVFLFLSGFNGNTGRRAGVWLRAADASNCYTVVADGGSGSNCNMTISKVVGGVTTSLTTTTFSYSNTVNDPDSTTLRGEVQGDNIRAYWRGQLILSAQDSTYTGPGFVSAYIRSTTNGIPSVIRWEAGPLRPNYVSAYTPMAGPFRTGRSVR